MRFMKLEQGNSRIIPSEQAPEREELVLHFKTFYLKKYQGTFFAFTYDEVLKMLDNDSVTIAFLEKGWKTQTNFEKFVDENVTLFSKSNRVKFI